MWPAAEAARRRAEEYIAKGPPPDTDTFLAMEAALKRSNLRLEAARKFGHGQTRSHLPGVDTSEDHGDKN